MKPSASSTHGKPLAEGNQAGYKFIVPHPVEAPHAVQVPLEVSLVHELIQDALVDPGHCG